jgi:hypothetical protein
MKDTHGRKQRFDSFSIGLMAALIAGALGLVVTVVDNSQPTPGEVHANAANAAATALDAGQASASDGTDAAMARRDAAKSGAVGSTPAMTSESPESSSSREDNHPASF